MSKILNLKSCDVILKKRYKNTDKKGNETIAYITRRLEEADHKINEDNPVPSLDLQWLKNKSIEYFKEKNIPWKDTRVTSDFISELIRQNGVETKKS